jgi:hypothetical protein
VPEFWTFSKIHLLFVRQIFMNPFKAAPRCVQWASVLLIALPIFDALVAFGSFPISTILAQWSQRLLPMAAIWAIAVGLLWGINVVRIGFALLMLQAFFTQLLIIGSGGFQFYNVAYNATWVEVPIVSLILCFLPRANCYFKRKKSKDFDRQEDSKVGNLEHAPSPVGTANGSEDGGPAHPKSRLITAKTMLVLALGLGMMAIGYKVLISPAIKQPRPVDKEHERIDRNGKESQVFINLRLLATAANQYYLDHSASTAHFTDLVGSGKYVENFSAAAGEKYPDVFARGQEITAVMPDEVHLSLDPETNQTRRYREPPLKSR